MLIIRHEQLEIFERVQFENMQKRIESAIATTFPDTCAAPPPEGATPSRREANDYGKDIVERGIERAVNLGIEKAPDFAAFIALGLAMRVIPPKSPEWISSWLTRPDTAGETRLAMIETQMAQMAPNDPAILYISERISVARKQTKQ